MSAPFTKQFGERIVAIKTDIKVFQAYDAQRMSGIPHPPYESCSAIWDTGAMNTVITPDIASILGLKSLGYVKMQHANGESLVNTYMINLLLPNKMEGDMADTDVLIGMDVITMCDFALTNKDGTSVFSFDIPSFHVTDYTKH